MSQSHIAVLHRTLQEAERFIAGFEDDAAQQPSVTDLLASLRGQIELLSVAAKGTDALPLASCALSLVERARWISVLDPLLRYAGSPGDWGYESKLGRLVVLLIQARIELDAVPATSEEGGAA